MFGALLLLFVRNEPIQHFPNQSVLLLNTDSKNDIATISPASSLLLPFTTQDHTSRRSLAGTWTMVRNGSEKNSITDQKPHRPCYIQLFCIPIRQIHPPSRSQIRTAPSITGDVIRFTYIPPLNNQSDRAAN